MQPPTRGYKRGERKKRKGPNFIFISCGIISHVVTLWGESISFPLASSMGIPASCISFSNPVQSMGDQPFGSETSMDQRLMKLERRLQEQHDSHQ